MTSSWSDHVRIMFGSWSDHVRIVPALELTRQLFSANFSLILECNFAWQVNTSKQVNTPQPWNGLGIAVVGHPVHIL